MHLLVLQGITSQPLYRKLLLALVLQSRFQFVCFPPVIPTELSCFVKSVCISVQNWACPPSFNRLKFCPCPLCQLWTVAADGKMEWKPCLWLSVPSRAGLPLSPALLQPFLWCCLCHSSHGVFLEHVQTQIFPFLWTPNLSPVLLWPVSSYHLKSVIFPTSVLPIQLFHPPLYIS